MYSPTQKKVANALCAPSTHDKCQELGKKKKKKPLTTTDAPGYQVHAKMTAIQNGSLTSLFSIVKERNTDLQQSYIGWGFCRDSGSAVWLEWLEVRLQVGTVNLRASLREQLLFSSPQSHQLCPFSERSRKSVFYVKFLNI